MPIGVYMQGMQCNRTFSKHDLILRRFSTIRFANTHAERYSTGASAAFSRWISAMSTPKSEESESARTAPRIGSRVSGCGCEDAARACQSVVQGGVWAVAGKLLTGGLGFGVSDRRREYVVADLEAVVAAEELQNIRGETRH